MASAKWARLCALSRSVLANCPMARGEDLIYNLPARSQLWPILTADIILCHKGYRFRLG